MVTFIRQC